MATAPSPNDLTRQQLDELDALLQRMLAIPLNPPDPPPVPPGFAFSPPPLPEPEALPIRPAAPAPNWRTDLAPTAAAAPVPHVVSLPPTPPPKVEPPAARSEAPAAVDAGAAPRSNPMAFLPGAAPVARAAEPLVPPVEPVPATLRYTPPGAPLREPVRPPASVETELPANHRAFEAVLRTSVEPDAAAAPAEGAAPPARHISALLVPFVVLNWFIDSVLRLTGFPGRVLTSGFVKTLFGLTGLGLIGYTAAYLGQQQGWISLPVHIPWPR